MSKPSIWQKGEGCKTIPCCPNCGVDGRSVYTTTESVIVCSCGARYRLRRLKSTAESETFSLMENELVPESEESGA